MLSITFEDINIAGATGLELRMLAAEDDDGSNEDWDASDLVYVEVDFDNSGTFTKVLQFANDGTLFNANPTTIPTSMELVTAQRSPRRSRSSPLCLAVPARH